MSLLRCISNCRRFTTLFEYSQQRNAKIDIKTLLKSEPWATKFLFSPVSDDRVKAVYPMIRDCSEMIKRSEDHEQVFRKEEFAFICQRYNLFDYYTQSKEYQVHIPELLNNHMDEFDKETGVCVACDDYIIKESDIPVIRKHIQKISVLKCLEQAWNMTAQEIVSNKEDPQKLYSFRFVNEDGWAWLHPQMKSLLDDAFQSNGDDIVHKKSAKQISQFLRSTDAFSVRHVELEHFAILCKYCNVVFPCDDIDFSYSIDSNLSNSIDMILYPHFRHCISFLNVLKAYNFRFLRHLFQTYPNEMRGFWDNHVGIDSFIDSKEKYVILS
ncbi:hypothetical protein RFI_05647 [Reticulomyxa filosa]|uniref:Uncharacterized protein n=1 Tax=Reticulomyxa filosa TaxID=46433 RepID=X6NYU6_RETFI|nr:hypothetical protein RFI_05647 [Reticulomyxa filosa]|eukprot:ETO31475.1 hypothetical protein RFI_05647 [Reticulomyxa filosa]